MIKNRVFEVLQLLSGKKDSGFNDTVKATGRLKIERIDSNGVLVEEKDIPNLVVTVGRNFIASRMTTTSPAIMSHMAVGTGVTAAAAGDTALQTQLAIVALTAGSTTGNVVTYTASYPAGTGTGALTEAGIFNASSSGTMLCRTVFSVVNKAAGDSINITWAVTIS